MGLVLAAAAAAAPARELKLVVASLDLALTTPEDWRLDAGSNAEELVLRSMRRSGMPMMRVRRETPGISPRERMREIALSLEGAESELVFESEETIELGGAEAQLVHAAQEGGSARLRMVVLPRDEALEHVFWCVGTGSVLERHWERLAACMAGSTRPSAAAEGGSGGGGKFGSRTFRDAKSGLFLRRPPPSLRLTDASRDELSGTGLVFEPGREEDAGRARLTLRRTLVGPLVTSDGAAGAYGVELRGRETTRELRSTRIRLAGEQAVELSWRVEAGDEARLGRAWFFKRGDALFRMELECVPSWVEGEEGEEGLAVFLGGIGFTTPR